MYFIIKLIYLYKHVSTDLVPVLQQEQGEWFILTLSGFVTSWPGMIQYFSVFLFVCLFFSFKFTILMINAIAYLTTHTQLISKRQKSTTLPTQSPVNSTIISFLKTILFYPLLCFFLNPVRSLKIIRRLVPIQDIKFYSISKYDFPHCLILYCPFRQEQVCDSELVFFVNSCCRIRDII